MYNNNWIINKTLRSLHTHASHHITKHPTKIQLEEHFICLRSLLTPASRLLLVTTLNVLLELASVPVAVGVREIERREEVACLFEIRASGMDLMDEVLDGDDAVSAERSLNDGVVGEGETPLVDLS